MDPYTPWGKSISIDLYDCDIKKISDPDAIKSYVQQVIDLIGMVAHGPCHIDRFGQGNLEGYSAMQFIETSSITIHCDEPGKRTFIDIFSCKEFDDEKAKLFSQHYFGATRVKTVTLLR